MRSGYVLKHVFRSYAVVGGARLEHFRALSYVLLVVSRRGSRVEYQVVARLYHVIAEVVCVKVVNVERRTACDVEGYGITRLDYELLYVVYIRKRAVPVVMSLSVVVCVENVRLVVVRNLSLVCVFGICGIYDGHAADIVDYHVFCVDASALHAV